MERKSLMDEMFEEAYKERIRCCRQHMLDNFQSTLNGLKDSDLTREELIRTLEDYILSEKRLLADAMWTYRRGITPTLE